MLERAVEPCSLTLRVFSVGLGGLFVEHRIFMAKKPFRDIQLSYWAVGKYVDSRLGIMKGPRAHSYARVCKALERDGRVKPATTSPKRWISNNLPYIVSEGAKAGGMPNTVSSTSFLESFEWRRVRMMALKKYGAKCMCCGATPASGAVMNVDHIKPRKLFPELALDVNNLQILCHECNHGKGNWDQTDWRSST